MLGAGKLCAQTPGSLWWPQTCLTLYSLGEYASWKASGRRGTQGPESREEPSPTLQYGSASKAWPPSGTKGLQPPPPHSSPCPDSALTGLVASGLTPPCLGFHIYDMKVLTEYTWQCCPETLVSPELLSDHTHTVPLPKSIRKGNTGEQTPCQRLVVV